MAKTKRKQLETDTKVTKKQKRKKECSKITSYRKDICEILQSDLIFIPIVSLVIICEYASDLYTSSSIFSIDGIEFERKSWSWHVLSPIFQDCVKIRGGKTNQDYFLYILNKGSWSKRSVTNKRNDKTEGNILMTMVCCNVCSQTKFI